MNTQKGNPDTATLRQPTRLGLHEITLSTAATSARFGSLPTGSSLAMAARADSLRSDNRIRSGK